MRMCRDRRGVGSELHCSIVCKVSWATFKLSVPEVSLTPREIRFRVIFVHFASLLKVAGCREENHQKNVNFGIGWHIQKEQNEKKQQQPVCANWWGRCKHALMPHVNVTKISRDRRHYDPGLHNFHVPLLPLGRLK